MEKLCRKKLQEKKKTTQEEDINLEIDFIFSTGNYSK